MIARTNYILLIWIFYANVLSGQTAAISGTVRSVDGAAIPGAYIQLGQDEGTVTDELGRFRFSDLLPGEYTITASFIGFQTQEKRFALTQGASSSIHFTLTEQAMLLDEVTVAGRSEATALKESTASVSLIETKTFYNRSIQTTDLLNTVSGVQVRQNGGMGSQSEIAIQGLSGRQVKLFVDGIPMDYLLPVETLGIGAALSMLPVHLMERIEVYKGAVPVSLGADALGGAINLVTRNDWKDYIDISTAHSSFHTRSTSLNARKSFRSGIVFSLSAFHNASDNDYLINEVTVVNEFGNPETISARKFHDRFRNYLVQGKLQLRDKPWVDLLTFSCSYGDLYDEIQHNFEMRQAYGQALNLGATYNTALQYEKHGIGGRMDADIYLGYNRLETGFIDTTLNIYNWLGEVIGRKTYGGEITTSQNHLRLEDNNLSGRILLRYRFSPTSRLMFNVVGTHFVRSGRDPVAAEYYGEDFFRKPIYINKIVGGMGFEKVLPVPRITSHTAVKAYQYYLEGFRIEDGTSVGVEQNRFQVGFSQSLKWELSPKVLVKTAYEYASRLPDRIEALGDFSAAINANPELQPETSHNVNVGAHYKRKKWNLELNGFYRNVNNIIILQAVPPPVLSKYENLLKVAVAGVEGEVQWRPRDWLKLRANATYQDLRNRSEKEKAGVSSNRYFGARLPNRPYFFGNGEVQFQTEGLLTDADELQIWWAGSYVASFFRYWEIDGRKEDKLTIPDQWLHRAGIAYTSGHRRLTLSLESQNIFNTNAYDNFRVQKPGRSWHVKLRLFITKS
ncbi:MAG: TonB-dependent receptor [Saprospiraceae bacterium]|nr:TonB-dependent receptor [Lewinella sp.]